MWRIVDFSQYLSTFRHTLKEIGLEPLMAEATAARQQWVADLKVKDKLGGKKTEDRATLVGAIRAALGRKK